MAVLSKPVAGSGVPAFGSGPSVARWAGAFGLAALVVFLAEAARGRREWSEGLESFRRLGREVVGA